MNNKAAEFCSKNKEATLAVKNIFSVLELSGNEISAICFNEYFKMNNNEDGKRVRCKYLAFPPINFICPNPDKNLAFHTYVLKCLVSAGAIKQNIIRSIRSGIPELNISYEVIDE